MYAIFSSLIKLGVLMFVSIALCQVAISQTSSKNQKDAAKTKQSAKVEVEPPSNNASWEWTKRPWTQSDKPYKEIRTRIDKEVAQSKTADLKKLVERYEVKARHDPSDPKTVFAWAYVIWVTRSGTMTVGELYNRNYGPGDGLKHTPFQANYEFARLRFLYASWLFHLRDCVLSERG